jgi:polysaccharide biosynthesis/export protein ExoF
MSMRSRAPAPSRWSIAVGLSLLLVLPAMAEGDFVLAPGDRIAISVHKRPDLSGEFRVLPAGYLSLPFVPNLPAAGHTLTEVKQAIVDRFRENALLPNPRVNIDLIATQPVFVGGDVRRPGSFTYQIGMTVQHAIAAAGGLRGVEPETLSAYLEIGRLREKLRQSLEARGLAMIRRARLLTERDDGEDFALPSSVRSDLSESKAKEAYESERTLLKQRAESHRSQLDVLARQIGIYKQEIAALEAQAESKAREGELVAEERRRVESLMERGLTPNSGRTIELQRILVQIEGERRALATNIVKARQEIARVEQVVVNLVNQRQLEITALLKEGDDSISHLTVAIEETRTSLADAHEVLPGGGAPAGNSPSRFIVRRGGAENLTIAARLDTPLLPGDMVDVPRR